jgi:geranylgeranyl diphosphate synthase type II
MNISAYVQTQGRLIEERLGVLIPQKQGAYSELYKAARYSLLGGGKRLRPILALATAETFGVPQELALTPACCLEMIHTYSMIHDDLPCMDDDDFRRGKPSLHRTYAEGHAVLAGDFLLTYPFEVLAKESTLTAQQKVDLIAVLAHHAGGEQMIAGQWMDLECEGQSIGVEKLRLIHSKKTGAMISASIQFGGILADLPDAHMELLKKFGHDIGLAFQIVDDILDVTASQQKHGKAVGSDAANQKSTYVTLLGLQASQHLADHLFDTAVGRLNELPCDTELLQALAETLVHRNS